MRLNLRPLAVSLLLAAASAQSGASMLQPAVDGKASPSGSAAKAASEDEKPRLERRMPNRPTLLAMQFDTYAGASPSEVGRAIRSSLTPGPAAGLALGGGAAMGFRRAIVPTESDPRATDSVRASATGMGSAPEPRNWAIVLAGLLSLGAIARRRLSS